MKRLCTLLLIAIAIIGVGCSADAPTLRSSVERETEQIRLEAGDARMLFVDMNRDGQADTVVWDSAAGTLRYINGITFEQITATVEADDPICVCEPFIFGNTAFIMLVAESSGSGAFEQLMLYALKGGQLVDTFASYGSGIAYRIEAAGNNQYTLEIDPKYDGYYEKITLDGARFAKEYETHGLVQHGEAFMDRAMEWSRTAEFEITQAYIRDDNSLTIRAAQRVTIFANWDEYGKLYGYFSWEADRWKPTGISFIATEDDMG
ncbi:MAG: hypothetical protein LBN26_03240 [Christensenellaceae bacterium]|jgi:type II secretory pathway pseudopilin PulG|nr:hypothetical protein [Christensenellaceae bacterium]